MKKITKKIVKGASKEALNVTTRAVGGAAADIAKESIKVPPEDWQKDLLISSGNFMKKSG